MRLIFIYGLFLIIFCFFLISLYSIYSPTPLLPYSLTSYLSHSLSPLLPFSLSPFLPLALFAFLRHRAKAVTKKKLDLLGKVAIVQTELSPRGAILAGGELWLAQAINGDVRIPAGNKVKVVGTNGHLLQVDSIAFD